ncbi:hypothetical protein RCCGEPOP_31349 [Rhizobium sp. Pop5]|nr:hypothetical protein RCCGEPOP_31349 [Rhizobium sp. Pop5]
MTLPAIILAGLAICALLFIAAIAAFFLGLRRMLRRTRPDQSVLRGLIIVFGLGVLASPFIAMEIAEQIDVLAHVPKPLEFSEIEYRLEESRKTGFFVYRLTDESADWARKQGSQLGEKLLGAKGTWRETPVDDSSDEKATYQWHPYDRYPDLMSVDRPKYHPPTIIEYLEKYGFLITIEDGRDREADQSIRSSGSFYSYGDGGSVTIVDPGRGKVYFAYAR